MSNERNQHETAWREPARSDDLETVKSDGSISADNPQRAPSGASRQQTRFPVRHDATAPTVLAGSYSAQRGHTPNTAAVDDSARADYVEAAQEPGRSRDTSADVW